MLEDLGLPDTTPLASATLTTIHDHLRTAKANSRLRAVFLASKENRSQPGELQGRESSIKFVHLEGASKQMLTGATKKLREQGRTVIPYAKGFLVTIDRDDD